MEKEIIQKLTQTEDGTSFYDLVQQGKIRESRCVYGLCPDGECGACLEYRKRSHGKDGTSFYGYLKWRTV